MLPENVYRTVSRVAQGLEPAQTVFKNARVLNVFTEEVSQADVAVCEGVIAGVGSYSGVTEIDCGGAYLVPGFVDAHLHLESTMVSPPDFLAAAVASGTTAFIVDPHEAANVAGCAGIDYILAQTEGVPANVYVMLPSCVPASPVDDNGATLTAGDLRPYLSHPRVLGLGEVMDIPSVLAGSAAMREKLALFPCGNLDGHAPSLSDGELAAYTAAGIRTDHEATSYDYAKREVRAGMFVHIREGSAARNLRAIVEGIVAEGLPTDRFCFCTDDKHVEDILREGHISHNVREAIRLGIPPVKAIKMATIQPASCYGLHHLGAIAAGRQADFLLLDSLDEVRVRAVYVRGERVGAFPKAPPCPQALKSTVNAAPLPEDAFVLRTDGTPRPVIEVVSGQILTKRILAPLPAREGQFVAGNGLCKAAVIERHHATGKVGVAPLHGFGLHGGAIACTVAHDSHNLIVVGDNDGDMLLAARELMRNQGGIAIARGGSLAETLPLPVMGLMSDAGHESVSAALARLLILAREMGVPEGIDPFVTLSFLSLTVIPEVRVTPRGMYDTQTGTFA